MHLPHSKQKKKKIAPPPLFHVQTNHTKLATANNRKCSKIIVRNWAMH
jgi:hypothetical protein